MATSENTDTHVFYTICMFSLDRLREFYGILPTLCRSNAFSWVKDGSYVLLAAALSGKLTASSGLYINYFINV
jgi:hypothetical protein